MQKSLIDIQDEMRKAAETLEPQLFKEYWQKDVPDTVRGRLLMWLKLADEYADGDWVPSKCLFMAEQ